ncbi:hypothetical protein P3H15_44325 [Rhodococcus sp. T2V]|uniref:hypothetical protein n=1 Tax=Rhodococcus sp. T2V TaxID=3034164 RepID=UPI0023E1D2B8|nr:hypothetical protein [Rhodococcus sp. T2V]MDF3312005.1 hypothetical protein [Rhodococcus sp. T2V]
MTFPPHPRTTAVSTAWLTHLLDHTTPEHPLTGPQQSRPDHETSPPDPGRRR